MRLMVIADVHANLPALEAVIAAARVLGVDRMLCLGDLVGYNAQPNESVSLVRETADAVVLGNHDRATAHRCHDPGTRKTAKQVQVWTRDQLDGEHLDYLATLPKRFVDPAGVVAVHGCFLNDEHYYGYVTSTMVGDNLEVIAARDDIPCVALAGHTHVPMVAWSHRGEVVEARPSGAVRWPRNAEAVLVNPGSVGQPRDGDPRAAFAVVNVERRSVEVHRVEYDIGAAQDAIRRAGLDPALAHRLAEGR
jgi:diadenosine tetraphosphatase ApaH/serine/threonine PP2A family protein phosphatase